MVNPTESTCSAHADAPVERAKIDTLFSTYEVALNGSNTALAMPVYAEDGPFKPSNSRSAVAADAVRRHRPIKALLKIPVVGFSVPISE
jgi:hypothetical protein